MRRSVVVALLLLALGGCAGMAGVAAPETAKAVEKARTVGVISAVGGKFALQKVGITVFGNELNEVPIGSWGLDDAVASRVSAVLSKRFTVKRIAVPPEAFAAYESPGGVIGDSDAALQSIVRKVAGSANCDLYIVVTRSGVQFSGTNQAVAGLGMVEGGGAINPDNVTLFAVTVVSLYDGRTFERLLWQRPGFAIGGSIGNVVNGPHRALDRTWWPATPQAVHSEKYKAATRTLLVDSVARTVPEMVGMGAGAAGKKGGA
jgi:hypothetical protein